MDDVLHPPAGGPALSLYVSGTNTIFLFVAVCVAYGMVSPCAGLLWRPLCCCSAIKGLVEVQRGLPSCSSSSSSYYTGPSRLPCLAWAFSHAPQPAALKT